MSTFKEVLNPISGLDPGDVVEVSVRRNSGPDRSILWKEAQKDWFVTDEHGEKVVRGDRGNATIDATDYSVTESDGETRLLVNSSDEIRFDTELTEASGPYYDVSFKQDGTRFATTNQDGSVRIYDSSDYSLITDFSLPSGNVPLRISWDSTGGYLVVNDFGPNVYLYETSGYSLAQTFTNPGGFDGDWWAIDLNFNNDKVAVTDKIGLWVYSFNGSLGEYELESSLADPSQGNSLDDLKWDEQTDRLGVLASGTQEFVTYDSSLNVINTYTGVSDGVITSNNGFAWRDDGYVAITSFYNDEIEVYDDKITQVDTIAVNPGNWYSTVDFDSDKDLAIGSADNNTYIYDESFNQRKKFGEASDFVRAVEFDPSDEKRLVSGSDDASARVYSVQRNKINVAGSSVQDTYEATVVNNGTGIVEINEGGSNTITSTVGNAPRLIDNGAAAGISKIDGDRYLVEGDIYEETSDGFERTP